MKRYRWLAILMIVAMLGITGFQAYWLRQNYEREKRSLAIKTEMAFKEAMMQLQVSKLNLDGVKWEEKDNNRTIKIFVNDDKNHMRMNVVPKQEVVSTINVIRSKLKDSLKKGTAVITLRNTTHDISKDSELTAALPVPPSGPGKDKVFDILYGVDSLQDSLRVQEIDSACRKNLQAEKLNVPFTILRTVKDTVTNNDKTSVTIGLVNPVTYRMQLGNTFPYLIRRITLPVLFSLLLLGITILSFVLLYRSLQKQQRLAELKNEFISNITHELKTPIATVGVAIEALKNFNAIQDPQRTKEYLDISSNELQRLSLLVDKVLKLSMFENKAIELKYEQVDMKELTEEVLASLRLQLENKRAVVNLQYSGNVQLSGDRLHLMSVIFNLLDNAIKYSRENLVINIDINEAQGFVNVKVADNGIGIPAEYKDKVFDKFFRVPHGDTHNAKGYGLGLSYAARVIRQHNGSIAVDSHENNGCTFTINLPKQQQ